MTLKPRDVRRLRKLARGANRTRVFGVQLKALGATPADLTAINDRIKAEVASAPRRNHLLGR